MTDKPKIYIRCESWSIWLDGEGGPILLGDTYHSGGTHFDTYDASGAYIGTYASKASAKRAAFRSSGR